MSSSTAADSQGTAPPPPAAPPAGYPPAPPAPPWLTQPALPPPQGPHLPRWLDIGLIVIGIGALLIFIGFLFGDAAASQTGPGSLSAYQGDLETFFVVTGFGVLLTIGGWIYRVVMIARRGRP